MTSAKIHSSRKVVFLRSFISALFLSFFQGHPQLKWSSRKILSLVFVLFQAFPNHLANRRWLQLLCCRLTPLAWWTNAFCASDKCFSAGDEHIENSHSNFSLLPHTANYQWPSNKTYFKMIATHTCSPSKMGGSYHVFVLTSEYASPISYILNSVLSWTKQPSSRLSWYRKR